MSKLRGLSRKINKGKKHIDFKMEKMLMVKNGYLKLTFPLTLEQFKILDLLVDYTLSFAIGDRSMGNPKDAEEWEARVKQYIDLLFGENSYYKCFGDDVATHAEIGYLFTEINELIDQCRKELKSNNIGCLLRG